MAQVVEPETTAIFCPEDSQPHRRRTKVMLRHDGTRARLPAMQPRRGENPVSRFGVGRFVLPLSHDVGQRCAHSYGLFARLSLRFTSLTAKPRTPDVNLLMLKIQVLPLKT